MTKQRKVSLKQSVDKGLENSLGFALNRKQIERLKTVSQIVVAVVATAGLITLAAAIPSTLNSIEFSLGLRKKFKSLAKDEKEKKLERVFYYLRNSGLIKFQGEPSALSMTLTDKSKSLLKRLNFQTMQIKQPKAWDKKWWLVAADIPTKEHRLGADKFRAKLKSMNFYSLQRTLWLYPYDPRKEISFIAETYGINRFITVMEINRLDVEDEQKIKKVFSL